MGQTKKTTDLSEPVWVKHEGRWSEMSVAEASNLDEPEGVAVLHVSATLFALMFETAQRQDLLARRRGPR